MKKEILVLGIIIVVLGLIFLLSNIFAIFGASFFLTGADALIIVLVGVITIIISFEISRGEYGPKKKTNEVRDSCYASEILSIRFAKGELTKKQYEDMSRIIDKDYIDFEVFGKTKYKNMIDFLLNMYRDQGFRYPEHQLQQRIIDKMVLGKTRIQAIEELNNEELGKFSSKNSPP